MIAAMLRIVQVLSIAVTIKYKIRAKKKKKEEI